MYIIMPVNPDSTSPTSDEQKPTRAGRPTSDIVKRLFQTLPITIVFAGCSGYFPLWLRTPEREAGAPHFSGPWTGRWEHTASGQGGPIQAVIPAKPGATGDYAVKFRAGWHGFFWGRYTVDTSIETIGEGEARSVTEKDLGPGQGGNYSLETTITPGSFSGTFRSKKGDLGTVQMERPK